ncbi:ssDNA binding protein [Gordonia phage Keelan]|nr:ssDNA binding protein [Gordonia phage Keelan]
MAMPKISGRGAIMQKSGLTGTYDATGTFKAQVPVKFQKSVKRDDGQWVNEEELWVTFFVSGEFGEEIVDAFGHMDFVEVSGFSMRASVFTPTNGEPRVSVSAVLERIAKLEKGSDGDYYESMVADRNANDGEW